jgi:hypothetical protein
VPLNRRARRRDERGVIVAVLALSMVALLAFAAFAVDLGAAWVERRNDQNGADAGALAGAVELAFVAQAGSDAQDVVDAVVDAVEGTVGPISDAAWTNPAMCPGEPPSGFVRIAAAGLGAVTLDTRCISVRSNGYDELRVRVPVQSTDTAFAGVIGVDELRTSAAAVAKIQMPPPSQQPPFVVPTGTSSGADICLRATGGPPARNETNDVTDQGEVFWSNLPPLPYDTDGVSGPEQDPCDNDVANQTSGQFGTLSPTSYSFSPCAASSGILEVSIADGVDHLLSRFPHEYTAPDPLERQDGALCGGVVGPPFPNTMRVDTGIDAKALTCGLMGEAGGGCVGVGPTYGTTTYDGRLRRGEFVDDYSFTFGGRRIDHWPLWNFLVVNGNAPAECAPSGYTGTFASKMTRLHTCLRTWVDGDGTIFDDSIATSARFTFLPIIDETGVGTAPACVSGGGTCVHFEDFVPAYFHRLYGVATGGTGTPTVCDPIGPPSKRALISTAGDGDTTCGKSGTLVHRLGGIVFDCEMLPSTLCEDRPPVSPGPGGDIVYEVRLVR